MANRPYRSVMTEPGNQEVRRRYRRNVVWYGYWYLLICFAVLTAMELVRRGPEPADFYAPLPEFMRPLGPPLLYGLAAPLFAVWCWSFYWSIRFWWHLWRQVSTIEITLAHEKWGLIGSWLIASVPFLGMLDPNLPSDWGQGIAGAPFLAPIYAFFTVPMGFIAGIKTYDLAISRFGLNDVVGTLLVACMLGSVYLSVFLTGTIAQEAGGVVAAMVVFGSLIVVIARAVRARNDAAGERHAGD